MEVIKPYPTIKQVDEHLLRRFDELVEGANAEDMARLLESWAKYVSSRRNNDTFGQEETEAERQERETTDILEGAING